MTSNQTEIIADEKVPTITIIREFNAPRDRVFRAWTDPDLYAQWVGPRSLTTRILRWTARTGGEWAFANDRDGQQVASFHGSFHEVRAPERLVWTFTYDGAPDGVSLETMTFEELPGGRTRVTGLSVVESFETRDAILASGMDVGVTEGYEKLDELLSSQA
ncbi:MAG: SRPBCC family protein [Micromonosporaceae bacterium]|nr:SRPBCC family protein [Micromonosporaceae bacterium]